MYLLDPEVQAQFADLSAGFRAAACSLSEDGSALKTKRQIRRMEAILAVFYFSTFLSL